MLSNQHKEFFTLYSLLLRLKVQIEQFNKLTENQVRTQSLEDQYFDDSAPISLDPSTVEYFANLSPDTYR